MITQKKHTSSKSTKISGILVPIDFSLHSSNALRQAILMAKQFSAQIDLLHAITPIYLSANSALVPVGDVFYNRLLKEARITLEKIAEAINAKEKIVINVKASLGPVAETIINYSKKIKANLIIMGTHGTAGVTEFFVGSNAFRVVNHAPCPVLTVQKRSTKKSYKTIVVPIRAELNSRNKVNLVAKIAKSFGSKIIVTGYTKGSNKTEKEKVKQYVSQVVAFLKNENIEYESIFLSNPNFTKALLDHAKKYKADLLAIMTKHDFSVGQILNGTYAQQFVNHSKIPVLSVPDTLKFEF